MRFLLATTEEARNRVEAGWVWVRLVRSTTATPAGLCRLALHMEVSTLLAAEVQDLAVRATERGSVIAFQSTLAAAVQAVQRALHHEEAVGQAALSLAQQGTLGAMTGELRAVQAALEAELDQGRCLLPARERRTFRFAPRRPAADRPSWSSSLSEAVEALAEGADCMNALASGQPAEAPSRALGTATADLLRGHRDRLAAEALRLT